jgi:hypothetical protein
MSTALNESLNLSLTTLTPAPSPSVIVDMSKFTIFASISGGLVSAYTLYILFTRSNMQTTEHPRAPHGQYHKQ